MYFSREDILKIQQALQQLGIKDSEFPEAYIPISENDTISIVQDGYNKKINVQDFISQLGFLHNEDFLNVTDKYDESYITLSEAIKLIPERKRKEGLVISFQDINGDWRIYQFRGDITQFNNETLWKDLYDFTEYIVNSVLPDEEDLTKESIDDKGNYVTKFKDKEYDPQNFSGMATKILRKNIVEVNGVKKNILTQEDFDLENCIYEIRYDFTLTGNVTIPTNCVLEFNGGSLTNGALYSNKTIFTGSIKLGETLDIIGDIYNNAGNVINPVYFYEINKEYTVRPCIYIVSASSRNLLTQKEYLKKLGFTKISILPDIINGEFSLQIERGIVLSGSNAINFLLDNHFDVRFIRFNQRSASAGQAHATELNNCIRYILNGNYFPNLEKIELLGEQETIYDSSELYQPYLDVTQALINDYPNISFVWAFAGTSDIKYTHGKPLDELININCTIGLDLYYALCGDAINANYRKTISYYKEVVKNMIGLYRSFGVNDIIIAEHGCSEGIDCCLNGNPDSNNPDNYNVEYATLYLLESINILKECGIKDINIWTLSHAKSLEINDNLLYYLNNLTKILKV